MQAFPSQNLEMNSTTSDPFCATLSSEMDLVSSNTKTVLSALRGQTITICDLNALLHEWSTAVNPHVGQVRDDLNHWLDRYGKMEFPLQDVGVDVEL